MPDKNDSLPILDDIIIPGDADKAASERVSNAQDSLWDENNETSRPAAMRRTTSEQPPDIEALTEQLVSDLLPELEQWLRDKIRTRLQAHLTGTTDDN